MWVIGFFHSYLTVSLSLQPPSSLNFRVFGHSDFPFSRLVSIFYFLLFCSEFLETL
uniref:Uncharacterized protein n=1 Tax=Rhizophora mucronata TaxID=61149 RepID=A0A2P2Q514_RHIMU